MTQEAYRPRRIKYYSVGYPPPPRQGTPPRAGLTGGGYPRWGTPRPGLMGGVPKVRYPPWGTPWPGLMGGTRGGVPPWPGLTGVPEVGYPPLPGYPTPARSRQDGYPRWGTPPPRPGLTPPGPGWGTPPRCGQTDGWTDTCQNITFPRTTYAVGNNHTSVTSYHSYSRLRKLVLDCYPYTTNELLTALRLHVYLTHLSLGSCSLITDRGLQPLIGILVFALI